MKLGRIRTILLLAAVLVACTLATSWAQQGTPLPGNKIPAFVDPLPLLNVVPGGTMETVVAGTGEITLNMLEFKANMMPSTFKPAIGTYSGTWVFGYRVGPTTAPASAVDTYIGPVIVASRGTPTQIRYVNNLTADHIFWREWTDVTLHSAFHQAFGEEMPMFDTNHYMGEVLAVPHLHGGEDPAIIDGGPEAWFASDTLGTTAGLVSVPVKHGPSYYGGTDVAGGGLNPPANNEAIYRYPNTQEASPLWFHDHLLGGTRLNATFGGLAGAYPLIDPALTLPQGLHPVGLQNTAPGSPVRYTIPLVLQDRMFDTNGQLFFPNVGINPTVHPYWIPEFVGDTIVVNGKVWPYLNVDQQRYRFYLINGSNSTPYEMFLQDPISAVKGPRMWVIATDGGYLDSPVLIDPNATGAQVAAGVKKTLLMMPGERYEIIIDFNDPVWKALLPKKTKFPLNLLLRNIGVTVEGNPPSSTVGRLMQFRVQANAPTDTSYNPALGTPLRSSGQQIVRLADPATSQLATGVTAAKTRELVLVEIAGPGGPLEVLVNNTRWNGIREGTETENAVPGSKLVLGNYLSELPNEGDTEVWEIVNTTMDSHPIHLHAVQFQILNREPYDANGFFAAYTAAFPNGVFVPGYGPPLAYGPSSASGNKYGGNPDVTPYLLGPKAPPLNYEAGWKDTAIMHPGEVTRIAVRFAPQDKAITDPNLFFTFDPSALDGVYVWHCHITDHEDNEMMRPYQIVPSTTASTRSYVQGVHY